MNERLGTGEGYDEPSEGVREALVATKAMSSRNANFNKPPHCGAIGPRSLRRSAIPPGTRFGRSNPDTSSQTPPVAEGVDPENRSSSAEVDGDTNG